MDEEGLLSLVRGSSEVQQLLEATVAGLPSWGSPLLKLSILELLLLVDRQSTRGSYFRAIAVITRPQ